MSHKVQVLKGDHVELELACSDIVIAEFQAERTWNLIGNLGNPKNLSEVRVIDGDGKILSQFEF